MVYRDKNATSFSNHAVTSLAGASINLKSSHNSLKSPTIFLHLVLCRYISTKCGSCKCNNCLLLQTSTPPIYQSTPPPSISVPAIPETWLITFRPNTERELLEDLGVPISLIPLPKFTPFGSLYFIDQKILLKSHTGRLSKFLHSIQIPSIPYLNLNPDLFPYKHNMLQ